MSISPALAPSLMGPWSIFSTALTFGILWFSTTSTVMPLGILYITGSLMEMAGAGPAAGFVNGQPWVPVQKMPANIKTPNAAINIFSCYFWLILWIRLDAFIFWWNKYNTTVGFIQVFPGNILNIPAGDDLLILSSSVLMLLVFL